MESNQLFTILVVAMLGLAGATAVATYTLNNNTNDVQSDLNDTILRLNEAEARIADLNNQINDINTRLAELTTNATQALEIANQAIVQARNAQILADAAELAANDALAAANAAGADAAEAWNAANSAITAANIAKKNAISAWAEADDAIAKSKAAEAEVADMQSIVTLNNLMQKAETISSVTMANNNIAIDELMSVNTFSLRNNGVQLVVAATAATNVSEAATEAYTSALKALRVAQLVDSRTNGYAYEYIDGAAQNYNNYLNGSSFKAATVDEYAELGECLAFAKAKYVCSSTNVVYENAVAAANAFMGAYDAFMTLGDNSMALKSLMGAAEAYLMIGVNAYYGNSDIDNALFFGRAINTIEKIDARNVETDAMIDINLILGFANYGLEMDDAFIQAFGAAEKLGYTFPYFAAKVAFAGGPMEYDIALQEVPAE